MKKFTLTTKTGNMTSLQGYIDCSYEQLEKLFGPPNSDGDGYKVSTEWIFESSDGKIVTIYDYKETNLYYRSYQSVEEFRKRPSYQWHIGAHNGYVAQEFQDFLNKKLKTI